jgi:hypothetical protein
MLDIETTKKLLGKPKMSDEKVEKIRNEVQTLAEIIIESYLSNKVSLESLENPKE